ncbi:MAG TPA: succinate dehydrogenase, hydrophobic membrane anchor protein [Xanthobacteraceae bacterium]|jgi:succinate dehydrogenase / fumarate reductase membrane anchor subunit
MRTPLGRVRGLGPAHSGTGHFLLQRTTAIANVALVIYFVFLIVSISGRSHAAVAAVLGQPAVTILLLAAILSIVIHMRVGMQVIIEDYVQHPGMKMTLLITNTFFAIAIGLTAVFAALRLSFGL